MRRLFNSVPSISASRRGIRYRRAPLPGLILVSAPSSGNARIHLGPAWLVGAPTQESPASPSCDARSAHGSPNTGRALPPDHLALCRPAGIFAISHAAISIRRQVALGLLTIAQTKDFAKTVTCPEIIDGSGVFVDARCVHVHQKKWKCPWCLAVDPDLLRPVQRSSRPDRHLRRSQIFCPLTAQ